MHTESLSAFMLLCCQLSNTVKDLAKWSVWKVLLLKPHILEIKFINPVKSLAYSLGWLSGLKFVQQAVDFKCPVRYVSALMFALGKQSSFPKQWQILKTHDDKPVVF